jgi:hypothetical protein
MGREAWRINGQLKRSGREIGEGELSIFARHRLLLGRLIFARKPNMGSPVNGSRLIDNRSANARGQLPIARRAA